MNQRDVLSFLRSRLASPGSSVDVEIRETHTAFVLLAGAYAYKMKKPLKLTYLDFSALEHRKTFLMEELRINQTLAENIYRRVLPVTLNTDGELTLDGCGHPVEWLLEMVRLPDDDMLDQRLERRVISPLEIVILGRKLSGFYEMAERQQDGASIYLKHLRREMQINKEHLLAMRTYLRSYLSLSDLEYAAELLEQHSQELTNRGASGLIVDGHGDLRLEHICMTNPPVVFDRLEFDENMRQIDIYDEINYLALETELAGYGWIGRDIKTLINRRFKAPPSPQLLQAYGLFRLFLRARLAIDHLLEPFPTDTEKWVVQAQTYLTKAGELASSSYDA